MYYHPRMFEWGNGERMLATCQALFDVWLDGVARHHQAHTHAVSAFCDRQFDSLRALSQARDTAQFAAGLLACAVPEPRVLAALSAHGAIVVDTHRKLGELVESHSDEMTGSDGQLGADEEKPPRKAPNGSRASRRRQIRA